MPNIGDSGGKGSVITRDAKRHLMYRPFAHLADALAESQAWCERTNRLGSI